MEDRKRTQLDVDMARLADGDRDAFGAVFRALRPALLTVCRRALANDADADDAAQLTLEKIFEQAAEYDSRRPALPWALTIAAWECATIRKRRQRARTDPLPEAELPSAAHTVEQQAIEEDLRRALGEAVEKLNAEDRATINTTFIDDT
jgi:RNA polymerase sigma factor (sigma-70 family)